MNLHKLIFTKCDSYKAATKITPKGVMVHSTGANNPNLKRYVNPDDGLLGKNAYNNHWNRPNVGASVHAFIGKLKDGSIATYQVLPFNYKSGHCGKSANSTHISFEICEDNLKDAEYFKKVYQEAVEFTAYLCKEYKLDPMKDGVVICHSEGYKRGIASNHGDVMHWFPKHGKSMDTFRADVKDLLNENKHTTVTQEIVEKDEQIYRVRTSWDNASSQTGAYKSLENAKKMCSAGYTVYDKDGKAVYSNKVVSVKVDSAKSFGLTKAGKYTVTATAINLRCGASTEKQVIETIAKGKTFTCYGYYTGEWLYGVSPSGKKGFCHKSNLKKK